MRQTVILSTSERAAWQAFASTCYHAGRNPLGHKASVGAALGRVLSDTYATVVAAMAQEQASEALARR